MSNGSIAVPNLVPVVDDGEGDAEDELRKEVKRLKQELAVLQSDSQNKNNNGTTAPLLSSQSSTIAMAPPEKSGYLFKWQDRSIGWGGTKW